MSDELLYQVRGGVGVLRVNRPEASNALNWSSQERFSQVVEDAARDESLRALIITGTGRAFIAGADLKEQADHLDRASGERLNSMMSEALQRLIALPVPVIAAVNGDAAGGGCEILTACDLRLASAHARLKFVQVRMGLTTGWGGTGRLVRLVGRSRAMELLLTGRDLTAEEAYRIGLVHRIVSEGQAMLAAAESWAEELKELPQDALAAIKTLVYTAGSAASEQVASEERSQFTRLWAGPNHQEAVAAFLEKRLPGFNRA